MNQQLRSYLNQQADELDASVQQVLALCGGDPMRALYTAVIANTFLMEENEQLKSQISAGYVRRGPKKSDQ